MRHPVEAIQGHEQGRGAVDAQTQMLRDLYGAAFPARMAIDQQILGRFGRLPGMASSRLGLEALTGDLDNFTFESYLGLAEHSEDAPLDLHSAMESRLHLGTKPMARGIL